MPYYSIAAFLDLHRALAYAEHLRELAIAVRLRELRALRCLDLLGSTFSPAPNGISANWNIARENDPISLDVRLAVGELPETEGDFHPRCCATPIGATSSFWSAARARLLP